nr:hypothetical protein CFP56_27987 [Quercus suber]
MLPLTLTLSYLQHLFPSTKSPNTLTTLYLLHKHLSKVSSFLLPRTYFDKHRSAFLKLQNSEDTSDLKAAEA